MCKALKISIVLIFISSSVVYGQSNINIDSLTRVCEQYQKDDTVKLKQFINLSFLYLNVNVDKAADYADRAITLAENINFPILLGEAYLKKAHTLERKGIYKDAEPLYLKSLDIFTNINSQHHIADVYTRLGSTYMGLYNLKKAKELFDKAVDIYTKNEDINSLNIVKISLASSNTTLGEHKKCIDLIDSVLGYFEKKGNKMELARAYGIKATSLFSLGHYSEAVSSVYKAIGLNEQLSNYHGLTTNYINLSRMYMMNLDYHKALETANKGIKFNKIGNNVQYELILNSVANAAQKELNQGSKENTEEVDKKSDNNFVETIRQATTLAGHYIEQKKYSQVYNNNVKLWKEAEIRGHKNLMATALGDLGKLMLVMPDSSLQKVLVDPKNRYPLALEYLEKALPISDIGYTKYNIIYNISKVYEAQGKYTEAYNTFKQYVTIKDSISSDEVKKNITRTEIQYEYDKKELALKYEKKLTDEQLAYQRLLTIQQKQELILSNKENDLTHLAYLKEQVEKQEKTQQLSLSEEREKGKERDLALKHLELSAQQKQNIYQGAFIFIMLCSFGILFYFYQTMRKQKNIISHQNQLNEQTISILSHDIKEPMMGVQFLLNKLNTDDPYIQRAKESINDQVASVNSIVSNLLQLKKTQNSEEEKVTNAIIYDTANKISQELNYKIVAKSLKFSNNTLHTEEVILPISSQKLYITLLNLITNAIKHSPVNGTIELYTKPDGIYIRDHGTGIDPNIMDKIGRQHIDRIDTTGGSGMGLLLVSNMLADSKLKLKFENLQDGGTLAGVVIN